MGLKLDLNSQTSNSISPKGVVVLLLVAGLDGWVEQPPPPADLLCLLGEGVVGELVSDLEGLVSREEHVGGQRLFQMAGGWLLFVVRLLLLLLYSLPHHP